MRKMICIAASLLLLVVMAIPVMASTDAQLPYVTDMAGLLSQSELRSLEDLAKQISEEYQCGVYIITLDDYTEYSSEYDVFNAAEDIYLRYQLGHGSNDDGIMLLLSMEERDYALVSYGSNAHYAFTDYGQMLLEDVFLDDFRYNDWYSGFDDYLNKCDALLEAAAAGTPVDVQGGSNGYGSETDGGFDVMTFGLILLSCCGVSGVICGIFASQMKTAVKNSGAEQYVVGNGAQMSIRTDQYTHTTHSRRKIQTSSSGGHSGGGGTTVRSSGFSGRSGKF